MNALNPVSWEKENSEEDPRELADHIMQLVRSCDVYTREDIEEWARVVHEDVEQKNIKGLRGLQTSIHQTLGAAREMTSQYHGKIDQALSKGAFSNSEAAHALHSFDAADMETKHEMLDSIDEHIDAGSELLDEFEESIIAEYLTSGELSLFKSEFKAGTYEKRTITLQTLIATLEKREEIYLSLSVQLKIFKEECANGHMENALKWTKSTETKLLALKNIHVFNELLDEVQELRTDCEQNTQQEDAPTDTEKAESSSITVDFNEEDGIDSDELEEGNESEKEEAVATSLVDMVAPSYEYYSDVAVSKCEDIAQGSEEEISEFPKLRSRMNIAFSNNNSEVRMKSTDKEDIKEVSKILTFIDKKNIRTLSPVIAKLRNLHVKMEAFDYHPQQKDKKAA